MTQQNPPLAELYEITNPAVYDFLAAQPALETQVRLAYTGIRQYCPQLRLILDVFRLTDDDPPSLAIYVIAPDSMDSSEGISLNEQLRDWMRSHLQLPHGDEIGILVDWR